MPKIWHSWHKTTILRFRFVPVHFHSGSITTLFIAFAEPYYTALDILRYL